MSQVITGVTCHVSRSWCVCADQLELELELVLAHWWTPGSWQPPGAGPGLVTSTTTTTAGDWRGNTPDRNTVC